MFLKLIHFLKLRKSLVFLILIILTGSLLPKCLAKETYYLKKVEIKTVDKQQGSKLNFTSSLEQKENRRILNFFKLKLFLYKIAPKKLKSKIGEAPIIYDSLKTINSITNIKNLLNRYGYFEHTISYNTETYNKNKIKLTYNITFNKRYKIIGYEQNIKDTNLRRLYNQTENLSLVSQKSFFNYINLELERERISNYIKDNGYYFFNKNYIHYDLDSSKTLKEIFVTLVINNAQKTSNNPKGKHKKYYMKNINVYQLNSFSENTAKKINYQKFSLNFNGNPLFKKKLIDKNIYLQPKQIVKEVSIDKTLRNFNSLNVFKNVSVNTKYQETDSIDLEIKLIPMPKKSISFSTIGKYTGGDMGIESQLNFINRNLLKNAENLTLSIIGGIEFQSTNNSLSSKNSFSNNIFTAFEIGPKIQLRIPQKFILLDLLLNIDKLEKKMLPKSILEIQYLLLRRPQYLRSLLNFSLGYSWNQNAFISHKFTPISVNYIKINLEKDFQSKIELQNNPFITNTYNNHFIMSTLYSLNFIKYKKQRFIRKSLFVTFDATGNSLNLIHRITNRNLKNNYYTFLDIRYAQYLKFDFDYRYHVGRENKLAIRAFTGIGIPYSNLNILPFEKSYSAGGANSMRAWAARSLGPGSSKISKNLLFNQVGDIKIELNLEYRFPIYSSFKGAFFADIGNIWTLQNDRLRPNAEFKFNRLYKDLAIGLGIGIRFDIDFIILRADLGTPFKNPQANNPNSLFLNLKKTTINIGIGYPF